MTPFSPIWYLAATAVKAVVRVGVRIGLGLGLWLGMWLGLVAVGFGLWLGFWLGLVGVQVGNNSTWIYEHESTLMNEHGVLGCIEVGCG